MTKKQKHLRNSNKQTKARQRNQAREESILYTTLNSAFGSAKTATFKQGGMRYAIKRKESLF